MKTLLPAVFFFALNLTLSECLYADQKKERKPNVILFLVDDMGWTDCGAYGSTYYKTPNIDLFAKQSMRFTDAYALPLCSPTRASILSGQYSSRHGVTSATGHLPPIKSSLPETAPASVRWLMPQSGSYLDPSQYTLAEALRDAGYTTAHIGKWHLGMTPPHWPEAQGFDVAFHSHPDAGPPGKYFSPYGVAVPGSEKSKEKRDRHTGTITDGPPGEYIVDRQASEAIDFIEANKEKPFFLNLWCYGVHGPWGHKEEYTEEFSKIKDPRGVHGNPIMASMLRSVDECFGRILSKLQSLGLEEDTIVIFTSDNGGNCHSNSIDDPNAAKSNENDPAIREWRKWAGKQPPTRNVPLRDGKGRLYEGGVRVPLMVRWPSRIAAGTVCKSVVGCIDIYPTVLELAGIPLPKQQIIDGGSYASDLYGTGTINRVAYFTWFPHLVPGVTVRQGKWKLIRRFIERPAEYEGLCELFDLETDLGEENNLATRMPEKVLELDHLIDSFLRDTGALYPKPNPNYQSDAASLPMSASESKVQSARDPHLPKASDMRVDKGPATGLVPRFCNLTTVDGVARMVANGPESFLGTAQVKASGPMVLKLRVRSALGGPCRVQWTTNQQPEFNGDSPMVHFRLTGGDDWQDVSTEIPLTGPLRIIRLYLPASESPIEIDFIRYENKDGPIKYWEFE